MSEQEEIRWIFWQKFDEGQMLAYKSNSTDGEKSSALEILGMPIGSET